MKIALYIEDGLEQIVLTPQTETEAGIVRKLEDGSRDLSIKRGAFYECQGGWVRHRPRGLYDLPSNNDDDSSVMIILRPAPSPSDTPEQADG